MLGFSTNLKCNRKLSLGLCFQWNLFWEEHNPQHTEESDPKNVTDKIKNMKRNRRMLFIKNIKEMYVK